MASTTTWLVVGVIAGVGIGVGAAMLMRQSETGTGAGVGAGPGAHGQPTFTEHTVIRDDQGRIISVQSIEGVGVGARTHHQNSPPSNSAASVQTTSNPDFIA